jgi:predicted DNA-binding transcriptional regulator AlpA
MAKSPTLTPPTAAAAPGDRLIGFHEMCDALGVAERTLRKWVAQKRVPKPIHLGSRRLKWRWSTVSKFLAELELTGKLGV